MADMNKINFFRSIARRIVEGNSRQEDIYVPLAGIAIGNGWVAPRFDFCCWKAVLAVNNINSRDQYAMYAQYLYENKLLDYYSTIIYNTTAYPACAALIDSGVWPAAFEECTLIMQGVLAEAELEIGRSINVYVVNDKYISFALLTLSIFTATIYVFLAKFHHCATTSRMWVD